MNALSRRPLAFRPLVPLLRPDSDLPPAAPLAMPVQALDEHAMRRRRMTPQTARSGRAVLLVAATMVLTGPAVAGLGTALRIDGLTGLDLGVLAAFALLFAWIAFAFVSALAAFAPGADGDDPCLDASFPIPGLTSRTAILAPVYNEDPHPVFARLRAMAASIETTGQADAFDLFILSDTTRAPVQAEEQGLFRRLRDQQAKGMGPNLSVFYRHRPENIDRKAGNIADWVRRFGGAYDQMVVLDADSLMTGDTLVRLAEAMEHNPRLGLIQTLPLLVNLNSLFARAQQFASRLYGPMLARGLAWWSGAQGNYWGHNAIIRVRAFAEQAGLPHLPGKKPFGGHILSHDFVEAALIRRAGWEVRMTSSLGGSYEESPPTLADLIVRDRRWCQGNLQHLLVLPGRGLHWISRLHLLRGFSAYLTAPIWLALMLMGVTLSLRPDWGVAGGLHPLVSAATRHHQLVVVTDIFALSMALLLAPKLMAFAAMLASPQERRAFGGGRQALAGLLAEMALSGLIAPVMMLNQIRALASILAGRDSGWPPQTREEGGLTLADAVRRHGLDTLAGLTLAAAALAASPEVFFWLSPVIMGLIAAIPLAALTARRDLGLAARQAGLFLIPEETQPPALISHVNALMAWPRELHLEPSSAWRLTGGRLEPLFG
ncbi:MAG TPA: glucans biosynthesis glucosyltransferase MdoH [Caulobacteraceae bacterium]|jgi:membrane glycosyltransferase